MSRDELANTAIDWNRAVFVDREIDDELVKSLTPRILALRQENSSPITVGIDSPGGSIESLDLLLGLLTGPTQDKADSGEIVTVAISRAYSAAANLLAFGNYSIALRHSEVLYHDVRLGGISDVTPGKALRVAKSLQDANDDFSFKLARRVIQRLVWNYVDLKPKFAESATEFPEIFSTYDGFVGKFSPRADPNLRVDIPSFATTLYAQLTSQSTDLVSQVMQHLGRWAVVYEGAKLVPKYRSKGDRRSGLLDGSKYLHKLLGGKPETFVTHESDLKLLIALLVGEMSRNDQRNRSFAKIMEGGTRNLILIKAMDKDRHVREAQRLVREHAFVFLGRDLDDDFESKAEEEQQTILTSALPGTRLFWLFCVMLCRELFEGEHFLKPNDAQLLGLVDQVAGGGPVESWREYAVRTRGADKTATGCS